MRILAFIALFCAAIPAVTATPALAVEKIESFASDAVIAKNGEITITETIRVRAEGNQIKHGIYRDFPTTYKGPNGEKYVVGFSVVRVTVDGQSEDWFTKGRSNGVRVYIGNKNRYVSPGEHTYRLTYRTDRQIGFHPDFDEFYWNVTGNGWVFPIDQAEITIHLPKGATVLRKFAYTGRQGAKGRDWSYRTDADGNPVFSTTAPLRAHEGLTVAVAFPKGIVAPPTKMDETFRTLRTYAGYIGAGIACLVVLVFYFFVWRAVGKDPAAGTIVPRWNPPKGISAAAARFIMRLGFDNETIGAAIVSLAVKGRLTIEETSRKKYSLQRIEKPNGAKLSPGEKILERELFQWGDHVAISKDIHTRLKSAVDALKAVLSADYEGANFSRNISWFVLGLAVSMLSLLILGPAMAIVPGDAGPGPIIVALVGLAPINGIFYLLLKAPTPAGRRIMDEIEGFKMYLATAEQERLNLLNPPNRTPELFERYLPYAIALGVENEWGEQFTDVFAAAAKEPGQGGYQPTWFHGRSGYGGWSSPSRFASGLGSALGGSIASAATPPSSSSSGSGGGGSSGGGGGGGGGGGW